MSDDAPDDDAPKAPDREAVDAASPEGVAAQRKSRKRKDNRSNVFWKSVLADETGRAEIWQLLNDGGAFTTPFQVGPNGFPQPEATWCRAGVRDFVLGLYQRLLAIDLEGVRLMLIEHDNRFKVLSES